MLVVWAATQSLDGRCSPLRPAPSLNAGLAGSTGGDSLTAIGDASGTLFVVAAGDDAPNNDGTLGATAVY